jgi:prevent-host-death family protein
LGVDVVRELQISEDILPVGEFKTQISRILRRLQATRRPIVITQNGKPAAVLLTPEDFDRLNERARFIEALDEGHADSVAGRVVEDGELTRELDKTFGTVDP